MNGRTRAEAAGDGAGRNRFGTFGGVFTPSLLTILGLILFMRAGFVVGQAGVFQAIGILLLAKGITALTSLSVCAIGTNMQVRGGGAYFLISRVLGPEFGGAIGIALFFAQALSVPFYLLGFTEALVRSVPALEPEFLIVNLAAAALLFAVVYIGAGWAIKAQYAILGILALSLLTLLGGAVTAPAFGWATWTANLGPDYGPLDPAAADGARHGFWSVFAIYFPAVTGILTGINMSGDLRDPGRSIPRGTLAAVGVGFVVYLVQMLLLGAAFPREAMIERPFETLMENALFGMEIFVVAGVFAATLSSALGSYMGAPRILQAVARDRILGLLRPFARGTPRGDEPRRALLLTGAMTLGVLLWAGNDAGGGPLNAVASLIAMFFLYTYGMINVAAFIEAFGNNPSFRPRFRLFHWATALAGGVGCVGAAFLIQPVAAVAAAGLLGALLYALRRRSLRVAFGDARRGFVYEQLRRSLLRLATMAESARNWRPTVLVFSGNPASRETLVSYAVWLEAGRGIVLLANVLVGRLEELGSRREASIRQLREFCRANKVEAFPVVMVAPELETGVAALLQGTVGPIRPNLVVFGWSADTARLSAFLARLRLAEGLGQGRVIVRDRGIPVPTVPKRVDIWWRGRKNGHLLLLLAHLLTRNWEWARTRIRILRVIPREEGRAPTLEALEGLIERSRVEATAEAIVSERPFTALLRETSADAAAVFLGFEVPPEEDAVRWHDFYESALEGMPTAILVSSSDGEEDLFA